MSLWKRFQALSHLKRLLVVETCFVILFVIASLFETGDGAIQVLIYATGLACLVAGGHYDKAPPKAIVRLGVGAFCLTAFAWWFSDVHHKVQPKDLVLDGAAVAWAIVMVGTAMSASRTKPSEKVSS